MNLIRRLLSHREQQQVLREVKLWCSLQQVTATSPETADTLRRRALLAEASKLSSELRRSDPEGYYNSHAYQRVSNLYEAADISSLALLTQQLRTPALRPTNSELYLSESLLNSVPSVIEVRSQLLRDKSSHTKLRDGGKDRGRLLLYYPQENLACGAARYSSNGFFDDDNVSAWDTWVSYREHELVSWVPEMLIPLVQEGIDANPEQCIQWAPE